MAKVKIQGNASGTGVLTVTAPNTSTDRTITLPDADVTLGAATPSITDGGNATAMTIDSAENIGIGVVPETWHSGYTALQVDALSLMCHKTAPTVHTMGNAYHDGSNYKHTKTGIATQYSMEDGNHVFRTVASGSADANITWTDQLEMKADGRGLSQFTAKAWCNFDGTGTPAFRDSHNCSSLDDNGTGQYDVNFTVAMGAADYSVACENNHEDDRLYCENINTTHINVRCRNASGTYADRSIGCAMVFGD